ncbi:hypothetical protein ACFLYH_00675 [Candidatus Dependentiae bacterium]
MKFIYGSKFFEQSPILGAFLICFCLNLNANELFIPKMQDKFDYMPPYQSNLIQEASEKKEHEELKNIGKTVSQIVKSSDKELEKKAEEFVQDKNKLNTFLSTLVMDNKVNEKYNNQKVFLVSTEMKDILNKNYQDLKLLKKTISLKLKDIHIREAIELIAKAAGYDFIIDSNVTGKINNLFLKDISIASALKIILSSNRPQLALIKDLDIYRILKLNDAVSFLKQEATELKQKKIVSDFLTISNAKITESFKLRVEKMWQGITVNKAEKDGYYLVFDDGSRKVFFRGQIDHVELFKKFLNEINQKICQVQVNTRVIITSKDFEQSLGLQLSGVYNRSASVSRAGWSYIGFGPVETGGKGDIPAKNLMDWSLNLLPSSASQFLNLPIIFGGRNLDNKRLNLVLNASEHRHEIKTILKPSLLVNSGEQAEILVGEQVPIETSVQERIEGSLRDINTINYKELGMKLKVKPVVSHDQKKVFLDVYVENSYIKDGVSSTSFNAKKSIIVTTKSRSRVLLKSGQTTMIGGLISQSKRKSKQGIPFLQDIPFLGYIFRGRKKVNTDDQLMIFISPTVI